MIIMQLKNRKYRADDEPANLAGAKTARRDPAMKRVYTRLSVIVRARILPNLENI